MIGMDEIRFCRSLGDEALLARLKSLAAQERSHLVGMLACLGETDRRRLFSSRGFRSMFDYCFSELRYSEGAAYRRIRAARAARESPEILSYLADGSLSLSTVSLLAPHLAPENKTELLARAQGKRKRDLERMLAELSPRPDKADSISYVGPPPSTIKASAEEVGAGELFAAAASPGDSAATPGDSPEPSPKDERAEVPEPPPEPPKVRFAFTASEELLKAVERARELLRHKHPLARLEDVFREAVLEYLDRHDPDRRLARRRSRPSPGPGRSKDIRRIPRWVRDRVWERDQGRCRFVAADGRRCAARSRLEFDHVRPWAMGGRSDDPANVRLLCRTHNQLAAREIFGESACRP
jgi:hypothetical protein